MPADRRIAVVGGGIGGLTLAIALATRDVPCTVYEQAAEHCEVGAGVALSANATRHLHRFGLGEALDAARSSRRRWCSAAGTTAESSPPTPCDEVRVNFENDRTVTADGVVGADGVHSAVRRAVVTERPAVYSGTVGYRGLVPVEALPSLPDSRPAAILGGAAGAPAALLDRARHHRQLPRRRPPGVVDEPKVERPCEVADSLVAYEGWHPAVTEMVGAVREGSRWALHDHAPLDAGVPAASSSSATPPTPCCPIRGRERTRPSRTRCSSPISWQKPDPDRSRRRSNATRRCDSLAPVESSGGRGWPDWLHLRDAEAAERRDARLGAADEDLAGIHGHDVRDVPTVALS